MNINATTDRYCTVCYQVVSDPVTHRDKEHDSDYTIDIWQIEKMGDGEYLAQGDDMGHFTPHVFMEVNDHEMCGECGAVKIKESDIPEEDDDE